MTELNACLEAARDAALAAGKVIKKHFLGNVETRIKQDGTPVTQVDIEAEEIIKSTLLARFPDFGFYGEETGRNDADSEYCWLVDPLDGTKNFVRGIPYVSVQIALMHQEDVVVGLSHAPLFNETFYATKNQGAFCDGRRMKMSTVSSLAEATVSASNIKSLAKSSRWPCYGDVVAEANRMRGYGDYRAYHFLASGRIDAIIEADVNILDIAALSLIVSEAGGLITDLDGKPVGLETTSSLAATKALHPMLSTMLCQ